MSDQHHWIPVSLFGINHPCNIVTVDRAVHDHIHQAMNYEPRAYSRMQRDFKMRHNHKNRWDAEMVEDILRMQGGYLHRYTGLAIGPQKMHIRIMNDLTRLYQPNHQTQYIWSKLWYEYCQAFRNYNL